jgi:hypothetical protein
MDRNRAGLAKICTESAIEQLSVSGKTGRVAAADKDPHGLSTLT